MEHVITFSNSAVIYAECSCLWGTPLADTQEELFPAIMGHLATAGMVKGLNR